MGEEGGMNWPSHKQPKIQKRVKINNSRVHSQPVTCGIPNYIYLPLFDRSRGWQDNAFLTYLTFSTVFTVGETRLMTIFTPEEQLSKHYVV